MRRWRITVAADSSDSREFSDGVPQPSADGRSPRLEDEKHRGFIRESDGAAIRRDAALPAVSEGGSSQVRHPSTKLMAFENRELRFRRSLAFAHASPKESRGGSVRAAEPPRDSLGSERVSENLWSQSALQYP
jgi:hypothetical protein